jgi:hypothetical protein
LPATAVESLRTNPLHTRLLKTFDEAKETYETLVAAQSTNTNIPTFMTTEPEPAEILAAAKFLRDTAENIILTLSQHHLTEPFANEVQAQYDMASAVVVNLTGGKKRKFDVVPNTDPNINPNPDASNPIPNAAVPPGTPTGPRRERIYAARRGQSSGSGSGSGVGTGIGSANARQTGSGPPERNEREREHEHGYSHGYGRGHTARRAGRSNSNSRSGSGSGPREPSRHRNRRDRGDYYRPG